MRQIANIQRISEKAGPINTAWSSWHSSSQPCWSTLTTTPSKQRPVRLRARGSHHSAGGRRVSHPVHSQKQDTQRLDGMPPDRFDLSFKIFYT
jgi:hypothetical protein